MYSSGLYQTASKPHISQARGVAAASYSDSDSVEQEFESVTDAFATELEEFTGSVAANFTEAVGSDPAVITKSVDVVELMSAGAAALARTVWCLAARWRLFSFSAGPR